MFANTVSVLASAGCRSVCILHRCLNRKSLLCSVGSLKLFFIYIGKPFNLHLRPGVTVVFCIQLYRYLVMNAFNCLNQRASWDLFDFDCV